MIRKGFNYFEKIVSFLENVTIYIASLILVCMTLLITIDTLLRYFFNQPIMGVLEITEYIFMVIIVYFGMSFTSREGGNIKIEFLRSSFPTFLKKAVDIITNITAILFFIIIGIQAWKQTVNAFELKQLSSGAVEFPMAPAYFFVVIGTFLLSLRLVADTLKLIFNKRLGD
jgi:TRAP-type C4-dicarboxylate transport system permease small subunit